MMRYKNNKDRRHTVNSDRVGTYLKVFFCNILTSCIIVIECAFLGPSTQVLEKVFEDPT